MKRMNCFFCMLAAFLMTGLASCKKDQASAATTIEYLITPMNPYFTSIKYTNESGSTVTITDPSLFTNGSKTISVTNKPFTAKMETSVYNSGLATEAFSLVIKVNGEVKKITQAVAPVTVTVNNSAEYTVQ
jgi:hypothetical protein